MRPQTTTALPTHSPARSPIRYCAAIQKAGGCSALYLELGFNEDESGRQVFEGMHPHTGSVRNYITVRFSQPGRLAGTQHTEKQYPGPENRR
jgi:hypothetical protein